MSYDPENLSEDIADIFTEGASLGRYHTERGETTTLAGWWIRRTVGTKKERRQMVRVARPKPPKPPPVTVASLFYKCQHCAARSLTHRCPAILENL